MASPIDPNDDMELYEVPDTGLDWLITLENHLPKYRLIGRITLHDSSG